jgi:carboxymethylenebutenolidase
MRRSRSRLIMGSLAGPSALACLCSLLLAGQAPTRNQGQPGDPSGTGPAYTQSDEVKAFRKTAIPVKFPSDDLMLDGWLYRPAGEGPFPALIWNHGSEPNPKAHPELGKFYNSHGFVLFLPIRRGHAPSPGKYIVDAHREYAALVNDRDLANRKIIELQDEHNRDVVAALEWLKRQPFVDRDRLAVTGCSYGGIQTLITAEKGLGVRAFIPFAPGAMSWANGELRRREIETVRNARAPIFLLQAENDYGIGPSEVLGPILRSKGGLNRAKLYPAYGTTPQEGHGGFACHEGGIAVWAADVLDFLGACGMGNASGRPAGQ